MHGPVETPRKTRVRDQRDRFAQRQMFQRRGQPGRSPPFPSPSRPHPGQDHHFAAVYLTLLDRRHRRRFAREHPRRAFPAGKRHARPAASDQSPPSSPPRRSGARLPRAERQWSRPSPPPPPPAPAAGSRRRPPLPSCSRRIARKRARRSDFSPGVKHFAHGFAADGQSTPSATIREAAQVQH